MIENFIDRLRGTLDKTGFKLYYGTKTNYSKKRDIPDREVLLEPFQTSPYREGNCEYRTRLNLWVAVRRKIDSEFLNSEGRLARFHQFMIEQTTNILKELSETEYIVILTPFEKIKLDYFEGDTAQTNNTQSLIRLTIEVIIYDVK